MPRTKGRGDGEVQGIRTKRRRKELFNKRGTNRVTDIKRRCLNINYKIGLIDKT